MTLVLGVKLENKVLSSKAGQTRPAYRLIAANRVWSQGRTSGRALMGNGEHQTCIAPSNSEDNTTFENLKGGRR